MSQLHPTLYVTDTEMNTSDQDYSDTDTQLSENNNDVNYNASNVHNTITPDAVQVQTIFKPTDSYIIPDFSEQRTVSSIDVRTPAEESQYHCMTTRGSNNVRQVAKNPNALETIIKKLDNTTKTGDADSHDDTEYITKSKFSTIIGEMRVDFLSVVNLIDVMNKSISTENEEITNIKKEIYKVESENRQLRTLISEQRQMIDELMTRTESRTENRNVSVSTRVENTGNTFDDIKGQVQSTSTIRVTKKRGDIIENTKQEEVVKPNVSVTRSAVRITTKQDDESTQNDTDDESIQNDLDSVQEAGRGSDNRKSSNSITDSFMDVKATKFKVVKPRTKKVGADSYGPAKPVETNNYVTPTSRQTRRVEDVEEKVQEVADTKHARATRLGLSPSQQPVVVDKAKLAAEAKAIRAKRLGITWTGSNPDKSNQEKETAEK